MTDIRQLLERQAEWQKARKALTWPEKIRMAERVRASVLLLRAGAGRQIRDTSGPGTSRLRRRILP